MHFYNFSQKKVTDYTEDNFPFKIILQIIVLHFNKAILIGFDILDVCALYTYRKIRRWCIPQACGYFRHSFTENQLGNTVWENRTTS